MPDPHRDVAAQLETVVDMFAARQALNETSAGERSPWRHVAGLLRGDEEEPTREELSASHAARVDQFFQTHLKTMSAVGLEAAQGPAGELAATAGTKSPDALVFELNDPARTLEFFRGVRDVMMTSERQKVLTDLVNDYTLQLVALAAMPTAPVEALYNARKLLKEFQRLGLGATEELALYIEELAKGTLNEHFVAESILSQTVFGPDKWHTDMQPEFYQESWDRIMEQLDQLRSNPQARDKHEAALRFLEAAADVAHSDVEARLAALALRGSTPDHAAKPEYMETLKGVRGELAVQRESL